MKCGGFCMGFHLVYQIDGATAVLYCKKINNVLVFPDSHHLQMEFIHVVDHTCKECDDNSLILAVIFCFCSSH